MTPKLCFESLLLVPFLTEESFIKNEHDADVKFCSNVFTLETKYLEPDKFQKNFKPFCKTVAFHLTSEHPKFKKQKF